MRRAFPVALAGLAAVLLAVTQGGCPTGTGSDGGFAFNLPPQAIISTDLVRGIVPLTVQFNSDRSSDDGQIVLREWDFGEGTTSQEISPRFTFRETGDFTVTLRLTDDDGAVSTDTVTVSVTQAPVPVITVDRTSAPSAPAAFQFSASNSFDPDGEITQYRWDFGDGVREFLEEVQHVYASSGSFRATLTVTDDTGVTAAQSLLIQVGIPQPTVEILTPAGQASSLVLSIDAPLWTYAKFSVDSTASIFRTAGLDGDRDRCGAQAVSFVASAGAEIRRFETGHDDRVRDAAITPDGGSVITVSDDRTANQYSLGTGTLINTFDGTSAMRAVAVTDDGASFIYTQTNGVVTRVELSSGEALAAYTGHTSAVNDVAISRDGAYIATAGNDRTVRIFRLDGSAVQTLNHPEAVNGVAFSPASDKLLATAAEDGVIRLWNIDSGTASATEVGSHSEAANAVAFSPDGDRLVSGGDDDIIRVWDRASGENLANVSSPDNDVLSVVFSTDGAQVYAGDADGEITVLSGEDYAVLRMLNPCISPVYGLAVAADEDVLVAAIGARNDIKLDTNPPSGNDIDLRAPRALQLNRVPSLSNAAVDPGDYFLWVELASDAADPVRAYADPMIQVVAPFGGTLADAVVAPLVDDEATIVLDPNTDRQVIDLGPVERGDRFFLSFVEVPGLIEFFETTEDYSLQLLNSAGEIFAWFQQESDFDPDSTFSFVDQSPGTLFSPDLRLIVPRADTRYYLVVDGGFSVHVQIERETDLFETRPQTVFVNFDGATRANVGPAPTAPVPTYDAADYNSVITPSPGFDDDDTAISRVVIVQTLRSVYAGLGVEFISSDEQSLSELEASGALPFLVLNISSAENAEAFGISNYVDPRNETLTGTALIFGGKVARFTAGDDVLFPANQSSSINDISVAIGRAAAHQVGHLLGLRHTDSANDIMQSGFFESGDPTAPRFLQSASPDPAEQFGSGDDRLDVISTQNAPQLLQDTIGSGS